MTHEPEPKNPSEGAVGTGGGAAAAVAASTTVATAAAANTVDAAGAAGPARGPAARSGHPINWWVFGASAVIIAVVAAGAFISPSAVQGAFGAAVTWAGKWFGSFYIILITASLVFVVLVAVTRYGLVKLGPDNSTPDFSTFSWAAMLFLSLIHI